MKWMQLEAPVWDFLRRRSGVDVPQTFLDTLSLTSCHQAITMGLTFSSFVSSLSSLVRWSKEQDVRILMLGLDSAGKVRHAQCQLSINLTNHFPDHYSIPTAGANSATPLPFAMTLTMILKDRRSSVDDTECVALHLA